MRDTLIGIVLLLAVFVITFHLGLTLVNSQPPDYMRVGESLIVLGYSPDGGSCRPTVEVTITVDSNGNWYRPTAGVFPTHRQIHVSSNKEQAWIEETDIVIQSVTCP